MAASDHLLKSAAIYQAAADSYRHASVGQAVTGVAATDLFTSTAHGYKPKDTVYITGLTGGAGLSSGALYFVIQSGHTANTFRVSLTKNGSTLDLTSDLTAGTVSKHVIAESENDLAKSEATVTEAARYATAVANA